MKGLSREGLAKLAAYIAKQDKLSWDQQLEEDFSPGGKHASAWRSSMPRLMLETCFFQAVRIAPVYARFAQAANARSASNLNREKIEFSIVNSD